MANETKIAFYNHPNRIKATLTNAALTFAVVYVGHHISHLTFLHSLRTPHAIGFSLLAKTIATFITPHFHTRSDLLNHLLPDAFACAALLGVGTIVTPITVYAALTLTIISLVTLLFFPPDFVEITKEHLHYRGTMDGNYFRKGRFENRKTQEFKEGVFEKLSDWTSSALKAGTSQSREKGYMQYAKYCDGCITEEKRVHEDKTEEEGKFSGMYLIEGERRSPDGDHFKGTFNAQGMPKEGSGQLIDHNLGAICEGIFKEGRLSKGKATYPGMTLEGTFDERGRLQGQGIATYFDIKYEGLFKDGEKVGEFIVTRKGLIGTASFPLLPTT